MSTCDATAPATATDATATATATDATAIDATGVKPASCVRVLREFKHPPRRHPSRSEMPRKLLPMSY